MQKEAVDKAMMGLDEGVALAVAKVLQEQRPRTANTNEGRNQLQAPWEVSGLPPLWGDESQLLNIESLRPASLPAYRHQGRAFYQQDRCLD